MQLVADLYNRFPRNWVIAQEVMFADATTFNAYNSNMRNLVMDKLMGAQMVVFNRLTPGEDTMPLHKLARAANRRIDILYDYTDGTTKFTTTSPTPCPSTSMPRSSRLRMRTMPCGIGM